MPRLIVIGDVHGCLPQLEALLGLIALKDGDRVAFLGDLVDKGPDSLGVVEYVRRLGRIHPTTVIAGNHEESALRLYDKAQKQGSWDGIKKAEKEPWLKLLTADQAEWIRSLPLVARPRSDVLLVHGGLFPAFFEGHGSIGEVPAEWHKGGGKKLDRMRRFLRIRHVYKQGTERAGQMVSLGEEGADTQRWAEDYDGREGHVFYGHDPSRSAEPIRFSHATAMDTGAVFGGRLTAAILEDSEGPEQARFRSVPGEAHARWLEAFEAE